MRFVKIGFGLFICGGLVAAGCGGNDSSTATGGTGGTGGSTAATGGTGGSSGATTGGTAGTGGATGGSAGTTTGGSAGTGGATGGSAGATTGGGAGMGVTGGGAGMATTGGSSGMGASGEGGGGPTGDECPATAPDDGDTCDPDVNPNFQEGPCTYGTTDVTTCACQGFMNPEWNCQTISCPAMAPDDGDMCDTDTNPGFMDDPCSYGMVECTCTGGGGGQMMMGGGMPTWNCSEPAMCPAMAPDDGDSCDTDTDPTAMDGGCEYGMTTCVCAGGGGMMGGGMQSWNCGTCPAMAPDDGDDCDSDVNAFCAYPSGNCNCQGFNDEWNCN